MASAAFAPQAHNDLLKRLNTTETVHLVVNYGFLPEADYRSRAARMMLTLGKDQKELLREYVAGSPDAAFGSSLQSGENEFPMEPLYVIFEKGTGDRDRFKVWVPMIHGKVSDEMSTLWKPEAVDAWQAILRLKGWQEAPDEYRRPIILVIR